MPLTQQSGHQLQRLLLDSQAKKLQRNCYSCIQNVDLLSVPLLPNSPQTALIPVYIEDKWTPASVLFSVPHPFPLRTSCSSPHGITVQTFSKRPN